MAARGFLPRSTQLFDEIISSGGLVKLLEMSGGVPVRIRARPETCSASRAKILRFWNGINPKPAGRIKLTLFRILILQVLKLRRRFGERFSIRVFAQMQH